MEINLAVFLMNYINKRLNIHNKKKTCCCRYHASSGYQSVDNYLLLI